MTTEAAQCHLRSSIPDAARNRDWQVAAWMRPRSCCPIARDTDSDAGSDANWVGMPGLTAAKSDRRTSTRAGSPGPREKAVAADLEIGSRFAAGSLLDMSRDTIRWQARGSRLRSLEPPGAAWPQPLELQTQPESAQPSHYDHNLAGWPVERSKPDHGRPTQTVLHDRRLTPLRGQPYQ